GRQRILEDAAGVLEDVHEEEREDPGGDPVQEDLRGGAAHLDASHGEAEEDGESGDRAEESNLSRAHRAAFRSFSDHPQETNRRESYRRGRNHGKFGYELSL